MTSLRKVQFICEFEEGITQKIKTDPRRFKQILLNLVSNSIMYTYEGSIKILVQKREDEMIKVTV